MTDHPRAAEFTVEQLLALAAQGAAHSEYWLKKACDLAGDASLLGSQISALKEEAKRLEATIRRRAA